MKEKDERIEKVRQPQNEEESTIEVQQHYEATTRDADKPASAFDERLAADVSEADQQRMGRR